MNYQPFLVVGEVLDLVERHGGFGGWYFCLMREWQLLIIRELPSIGDGLNSLEVEEPIISEEKSLSFLTEDGIGVGYSMDDLCVRLLLDVL